MHQRRAPPFAADLDPLPRRSDALELTVVGPGERVGQAEVVVVGDHVRRLDLGVGKRRRQRLEEGLEAVGAGALVGSWIVVDRVLGEGLGGRVDVSTATLTP
jgi:hypothetical protein